MEFSDDHLDATAYVDEESAPTALPNAHDTQAGSSVHSQATIRTTQSPRQGQENIQDWLKYHEHERPSQFPESESSLNLRPAGLPLPGGPNVASTPIEAALHYGQTPASGFSTPSHRSQGNHSVASVYSTPAHSSRKTNPKQKRRLKSGQCTPTNRARSDQFLGFHNVNVPPQTSQIVYESATTASDGTSLYRLSNIIPYLLGTPRHVEGLQRIHVLNVASEFLGGPLAKQQIGLAELGEKDQALLCAALLAGCDPSEETCVVMSPFDIEGEQIKVLKDMGNKNPEATYASFTKLCSQIREWKATFPAEDARLSERWKGILDELRARHTPIEYVPAASFKQLLSATPEDTASLMDRVQGAARAGSLADRKERLRALGVDDSFSYHEPEAEDPSTMYSMRFSHAAPMGSSAPYQPPVVAMEQKAPKVAAPRQTPGSGRRCVRMTKWTVSSLFAVSVVGGILVAIYFKVGQKHRGWNQE